MWDTFSYANGGLYKVRTKWLEHIIFQPGGIHLFTIMDCLSWVSFKSLRDDSTAGKWQIYLQSYALLGKIAVELQRGEKKISTGFSANRTEDLHLPLRSLKSLCHNITCARKHRSAPPEGRPWCHCECARGRGGFTLGVNSPLTMRAAPATPGTANLVSLCGCICSCLIAAKGRLWVDQNTNVSDCLPCFRPLINFQVNLVKLLANELLFGAATTRLGERA